MSTSTDMLAKYLDAEAKLLAGKSVRINGRQLVHEDLAMIRAGRKEWEGRVAAEESRAAGTNPRRPIQVVL